MPANGEKRFDSLFNQEGFIPSSAGKYRVVGSYSVFGDRRIEAIKEFEVRS